MTKRTVDDIAGLEFDWLASDADGHVGFFSTAGGGAVPRSLLDDLDRHEAAIDVLLALPASTVAARAPVIPGSLKNDWRLLAERGLFAFDSDLRGGPYRLVAVPRTPVLTTALPASVREVVSGAVLAGVRFKAQEVLTSNDLGEPA